MTPGGKPIVTGLLGPQMKANRATTHLQELQRQTARFKANPYTVSKQDDKERGLHIIKITLLNMDEIVPMLMGDLVHCLRSSLDHLAWQLAALSGKRPSNSSAFPMHASDSVQDRERFIRCTWNIPCEALEIIKSLQPYQRGNDFKSHPLWQLNKLSNLDKHVFIGYKETGVQFRFITHGVPEPPWVAVEDTQDVDIYVPIANKGKVDIELEPPELVFGKPREVPGGAFDLSEAEITEIHRFVCFDVLPKFAKFFPGMNYGLRPTAEE